jgi:hypothetical protein
MKTNLVDQARTAVTEITSVRKDFGNGKIGSDQASVWVGLFNSTARVLNTAVNIEKWASQNTNKSKLDKAK